MGRSAGHGRRSGGELIELRLEPLYRVIFTTPEAWSVVISRPGGVEGQSLLIAKGRCDGRLSGRYRGALDSRLNDVVCRLAGKIRPREGGGGFEVVVAWPSSSGSPFHR